MGAERKFETGGKAALTILLQKKKSGVSAYDHQPCALVLDPTARRISLAHAAENWGRRCITRADTRIVLARLGPRVARALYPFLLLAGAAAGGCRVRGAPLLLGLLLATTDCGALRRRPGGGTYREKSLLVSDTKRSYIRYAPTTDRADKLLILLHGGGGKPVGMINLARDLPQLADQHGIVLVYPAGIGGHWNDGRAEISDTARAHTDDVGFLRAVIAEESKAQQFLRVGVAGISNGGMMAQRIACELSGLVSLTATVAANLSVELSQNCRPKSATSVLFIVGVEDPIVPYHGGAVRVLRSDRGHVLSIDDSLNFWSKNYHCSPAEEKAFTASSVERRYRCERGNLRLVAVKNGGHAWPGGTPYLPERIVGKVTQEFSASQLIVQMLMRGR